MRTFLGFSKWPARLGAFLVAGAMNAAALAAYVATGALPFSRSPDAEAVEQLASAEVSGEDLDALFADTGFDEGTRELEVVEQKYAFGLLPGGPGLDTLSVAFVGGLSGVMVAGVVLLTLEKKQGTVAGVGPA